MIHAIIKEIELSSLSLLNEKNGREIIETVYFGGGTPSLLGVIELESIMSVLKRNNPIGPDCEITLEANPDDITTQKLSGWKKAGVNRLSIGIQSFKESDLKWMNRSHTKEQAINCISLAQAAGFSNLSVDLIFGTPGLSNEELMMNVETIFKYGIPHIACYALTVEPKTALQKMILLKKKPDVNTDDQARQFSLIMKWMKEAGYEHYEISNFAKPGFRSRHNSGYWQGKKYLGFGPSAHSFDGKNRKWNVANDALYIQAINKNRTPYEEERLTDSDRLNEYVMTSLRTIEGMDLRLIENNFSKIERNRIEDLSKKYIEGKMMTGKNDVLVLTDKGKLFADGIAADLFQTS